MDATAYELEELLKIGAPREPADFAKFWQNTFQEVSQIELNLERQQIGSPWPGTELFEVNWNSLGGRRVGGWLTVPTNGTIERGLVVGHGYGGRSEAGNGLPGPRAAAIFPCARGFHRSAFADIPGDSSGHVLTGLESKEAYVHRGCVADYWTAASVLLELYPDAAPNLHYHGGSFGGGIGALLLPWDNRFSRAFLDVPSFGNHPLRLTIPCHGSGGPLRQAYLKNPGIARVLAYFDAASAAAHTKIPVFVAAALQDESVPPLGQFAVYNALAGPKKLFVRQSGHPTVPSDDAPLHSQLKEWFSLTV